MEDLDDDLYADMINECLATIAPDFKENATTFFHANYRGLHRIIGCRLYQAELDHFLDALIEALCDQVMEGGVD